MIKEQICFRYPNTSTVIVAPRVVDVPDSYSGVILAQEGMFLNKDLELGDVAANTVWFIPPSQILWVKRL
ncbi:hypothetical protein LCGC14_0481750 [marine sediment metagenome]|uniref:Uncharacterized protein n=1 Tax=marine sediment metagenome TaxID=412755 RepID=A0A0F9S980_9ZZZZ